MLEGHAVLDSIGQGLWGANVSANVWKQAREKAMGHLGEEIADSRSSSSRYKDPEFWGTERRPLLNYFLQKHLFKYWVDHSTETK